MHIHTSIYVYIYTYYISSRTKIYVIHRAGMIAKTATNPLERIKMLSQTGEHGGGSAATNKGKLSILDLYRSIMRNEGIAGLWAGNGANLLRVFPVRWLVFGIWYGTILVLVLVLVFVHWKKEAHNILSIAHFCH